MALNPTCFGRGFNKKKWAEQQNDLAHSRHYAIAFSKKDKDVGTKEKGAALVEFAFVAVMYFTLLLAIIEFGTLFWVNLTMQYAVREGARFAVTGQTCIFGNPPTQQQRYLCVIKEIQDSSMGLYGQISPSITTTINSGTPHTFDPNNPDPGIFGNKNDIVVLQLNCSWKYLTPVFSLARLLAQNSTLVSPLNYNFSVAATMRNEDF